MRGCTVMTDCLPSTWDDGRSNHISPAQACWRTKSPGARKGHPPFRRRWTLVSPASDLAWPLQGFYEGTSTA